MRSDNHFPRHDNLSFFHLFFPLVFLYLLHWSLFLTGCALQPPEPCIKNKHVYGVTDDWILSDDWDSCYRRAISYVRGGCRNQAAAQFLQAIRQRPDDQWRARSYGMHVLDEYFPHRELGILYLQQGKLKEAIEELATSLASADSAKAKYYLNQARRQWLEETGQDHAPPQLQWPEAGKRDGGEVVHTNSSTYRISGRAADDFFVSSILVNDQPLFLDLARPEVTFRKEVPLHPGINHFSVRVIDLASHEYREDIRILLDQQGPAVVFGPVNLRGNPNQQSSSVPFEGSVIVKGVAFDAGGLDKLTIAGEQVPLMRGEKIKEFQLAISTLAPVSAFQARDLAGNVTTGVFPLIPDSQAAIELADSSPPGGAAEPVKVKSPRSPQEQAPRITIEKCPSRVFQPGVVIRGWVESTSEITGLWVNEEPVISSRDAAGILQTLRRLWYGGRTFLYFTRIVEGLKEGKNRLTILASDGKGRSTSRKVMVEYQVREVDRIGNRWQLAILPFKVYDLESPDQLFLLAPPPGSLASLGDKLHSAFCESQRFSLLEREQIDAVIRELGLQASTLADKATGPRLGRILAAEVLLTGSFREEWDGQNRCLECVARLVDVETSQELAVKSVYNRWKTIRDEHYLLSGLARIFQEEFPLVQGKVVDKNRKAFGTSLSAADLIKQGMKVLVFRPGEASREGEEISVGKEPHAIGKDPTIILGEARVEEVTRHSSLALPSAQELLKTIKVGDFVITK